MRQNNITYKSQIMIFKASNLQNFERLKDILLLTTVVYIEETTPVTTIDAHNGKSVAKMQDRINKRNDTLK